MCKTFKFKMSVYVKDKVGETITPIDKTSGVGTGPPRLR